METHSSILAWKIPMDKGAWWATVHGITKSRTQLSDEVQCGTCMCTMSILLNLFLQAVLPLQYKVCDMEKEMATHSSTRAWKIPWMEEPGSYSPWVR